MPGPPPNKWKTFDTSGQTAAWVLSIVSALYGTGYWFDPALACVVSGTKVTLAGYNPAPTYATFICEDRNAYASDAAWDTALGTDEANGFVNRLFAVGSFVVFAK